MDRHEMWVTACKRFQLWAAMYADKNVTDEQLFNELCCSVYAGEEFEDTTPDNQKNIKELKANLLIKHGIVRYPYEENKWDVCTKQVVVFWHGRKFELDYVDDYLYEINEINEIEE